MLASNKKAIFKLLVLFFIISIIFNIKVFAVVKPTSDFYVNDYAGLLNSETKEYIINTNKTLYNQTGAQIVVVTIQSLENNSIEEYATQLFRNFGIGDKTKNNGVLMLLALEEREFRIEVGYGLEGCLPDGKTGRIQDEYIIPYLSQNNWSDGIKNGYSAILEVVSNEYNIPLNIQTPETSELVELPNLMAGNLMFVFTTIPTITFVFGIIIKHAKLKKEKLTVVAIIYMIIAIFIISLLVKEISMIIFGALFNLIALLAGMNKKLSGGTYTNSGTGGFSSRRSSFSSSSSSSHSRSSFGGGGSSGGGGSTRKF